MQQRPIAQQLCAEFLGTFTLLVFGLGVNAQVTLSEKSAGDYFSINMGWGLGVALGIFVAGGISGAHLNPAVTLAVAVWRGFPKTRIVPFIAAQLVGALVASSVIYVTYYDALMAYESAHATADSNAGVAADHYSMETAGIYATYPASHLSPIRGGLVDQIVGTTVLLMCIFAIGDQRNVAPQYGLGAFAVGALVLMIGMSFGFNCGYAINPVRDFGPRLFTYFAGWGPQVFEAHDGFWWVPIVGPCIGGILGGGIYDLLILRRHPQ
jgi:MIP family channel proteins